MAAVFKTSGNWRKIQVSLSELCIDTTLRCGQSFRWRKDDEWQDSKFIHYKATWPDHNIHSEPTVLPDDTEDLLKRYFSLSLDLQSLYDTWSKADANFRKKAAGFSGVRILSQDAWEALICFICSSNNNISRISQMARKLCNYYGPLICHIGDEPIHDFPAPDALTGASVESNLRNLGFGYRAKYIAETARIVALEKPALWLESLRNPIHKGLSSNRGPSNAMMTYKYAHEALLTLPGVGPKVADCVCLMGLGWGESVPVDTHVWQIAQRDYKFGSKKGTLNKALYDSIGDHFRNIWGQYAGWAHSVLFTADLRAFSTRENTVEEGQRVKVIKETDATIMDKKNEGIIKLKVEETTDVNGTGDGGIKTIRRKSARQLTVKRICSADDSIDKEFSRNLKTAKRQRIR